MSESVADATAVQVMGSNKIHFSKEVKQVIDKVRQAKQQQNRGIDNEQLFL